MRILIPVLGFGNAGGYRVLSKLANELIQLGHVVEFLCPRGSTPPYFPTLAGIWWIDNKGNITKHHNKDALKENAFSIQQKLKNALSKIPKDAYDVILANHSLTVLPIKRSGWASKTLYYVQAYEPDFYLHLGGLKNRLLSRLSAMSYHMDLFTVVNADLYLNYKELTASRTLYPGVDSGIFYPKNVDGHQPANNRIIIGTVGRMERIKGTHYVLAAFKILKAKYPLLELHVAFGDPSDFIPYEGVRCFQPHGDEALANFYRSLDYYFCAASVQLGAFHYPIAEAMFCGIPVITTQYYPANDQNAWLTTPRHVPSIVKQFEQAHADNPARQKKVLQALEDVKQFDWKLVASRLNYYLAELSGIKT